MLTSWPPAGATTPTSGDIVLDFFAGSGTTGHAVASVNAEDGGNRTFIVVQSAEPIPPDRAVAVGYCEAHQVPRHLAALAAERLKRVQQTQFPACTFRYLTVGRE